MRDSGDFNEPASFGARLLDAFRNLTLLALFCMVGIALLRFTNVEQTLLFGAIPLAPAAALVLLVLFGLLRSVPLFVVSVMVAFGMVVLALPGTLVPRLGCDIASNGASDSIVVMSHNVLINNIDVDSVAAQIASVEPDVLLLQELAAEFSTDLFARISADYPHVRFERNQAFLSKWPLTETVVVELTPGTKPLIMSTVQTAIGNVRIANFHADPPFRPALRAEQKQQFEILGSDPTYQEIDVLMGDFNAPSSDKRYRAMRDGRTDAHRVAGCGLGTTWAPGGRSTGWLSLDHALLSPNVRAEVFEVLDYAGSDHKAIAVRLGAPLGE